MNKALPPFEKRPFDTVHHFMATVLTAKHKPEKTRLRKLLVKKDGSYRAIFAPDYFLLAEGQAEPSKSQWNTLKKKMKRHDRAVFVFKEHGTIDDSGVPCYFVDFGFFVRHPPYST